MLTDDSINKQTSALFLMADKIEEGHDFRDEIDVFKNRGIAVIPVSFYEFHMRLATIQESRSENITNDFVELQKVTYFRNMWDVYLKDNIKQINQQAKVVWTMLEEDSEASEVIAEKQISICSTRYDLTLAKANSIIYSWIDTFHGRTNNFEQFVHLNFSSPPRRLAKFEQTYENLRYFQNKKYLADVLINFVNNNHESLKFGKRMIRKTYGETIDIHV
jgi:hypothetical protein